MPAVRVEYLRASSVARGFSRVIPIGRAADASGRDTVAGKSRRPLNLERGTLARAGGRERAEGGRGVECGGGGSSSGGRRGQSGGWIRRTVTVATRAQSSWPSGVESVACVHNRRGMGGQACPCQPHRRRISPVSKLHGGVCAGGAKRPALTGLALAGWWMDVDDGAKSLVPTRPEVNLDCVLVSCLSGCRRACGLSPEISTTRVSRDGTALRCTA